MHRRTSAVNSREPERGNQKGGAPKGETPRGEKEEGKGAKREKNVKGSL